MRKPLVYQLFVDDKLEKIFTVFEDCHDAYCKYKQLDVRVRYDILNGVDVIATIPGDQND